MAPKWDGKFEFPDHSCSVANINSYSIFIMRTKVIPMHLNNTPTESTGTGMFFKYRYKII